MLDKIKVKTYILLTDERVQCIFFLLPEDKWDLVLLEMKNDKLYYNCSIYAWWLIIKIKRKQRKSNLRGTKERKYRFKENEIEFYIRWIVLLYFFIVTPAILRLKVSIIEIKCLGKYLTY